MGRQSWHILEEDLAGTALPNDLRARDPNDAIDCGWVAQMVWALREFSQPGDRVLDPFCGFGSTLVACEEEGRAGFGCDIDPERVAICRERLRRRGVTDPQVVIGDARDLPYPNDLFDLCLTNLPYFGFDSRPQSPTAGDIYASPSFAQYLELLSQACRSLRRVLAPSATVIIMAENIRLRSGVFVPLAWEAARILAQYFELQEERILCYRKPSAPAATSTHTNRSHEYALVARQRQTRVDIETARTTLLDLAGRAPFVVIGSVAVELFAPGKLGRAPRDIDIVVDSNSEHLEQLVLALQRLGFIVTSWGEPVQVPLDANQLQGRFYLRGERLSRSGERLLIDLTYESTISFTTLWTNSRTVCNGISVASMRHVLDLMRLANKDDVPELAARLGIPV